MRAREFTINIPINIKINDDGSVDVDNEQEKDQIPDNEKKSVPPLQQKIELMKSAAGKDSKVIRQLTADEEDVDDSHEQDFDLLNYQLSADEDDLLK